MLWIVLFCILGFVGFVGLLVAIFGDDSGEPDAVPKGVGFAVVGVVILLQIGLTFLASVHFVDARNVGVVRTFGSIKGQIGEGMQFTWPWQSVEEWDVRLKVLEPDTTCSNGAQKCMDAGSVDIQDVYVQGVLNIEVDPRDVQELARNVGRSYEDTIVRNRLYQVVKQTTATYKAQDILANREKIRAEVISAMQKELQPYSIHVQDFLITNIDFRIEFKEAIEEKARIEQQALAAENSVKVKEAEARQKEAEALGRANSLRIEAEVQAAANSAINASLTPQLIQFQAVQKLVDNIQIALVPGEGNILGLGNILTQP